MKYRVLHRTRYRYAELVPLCHNVIHIRPRDTARQSCLACRVDVTPTPAARRDRRDFYGNHMTWLSIQESHQSLTIQARSEVDVAPFRLPADGGPRWEAVADAVAAPAGAEAVDAAQYAFASPYVPRAAELADYARPSFPPGRPLLDAVRDLTTRIYREFKFKARSTTIGTPVLEVLKHRHGVCQDFAHLQIACLRSLNLAARYVSGYVLTRPPPGKPRLVGADASHAWLSAYCPGHGWVDFDPTNGSVPSDEHVTLGWARDYDDIGPVKGVLVGGHSHDLSVSVDVAPLPADGDEEPTTDEAPPKQEEDALC